MNLRTIIADDEPLSRDKLRDLLAEESGVRVVAECGDGEHTIAALKNYRPDLLLLDIEMPRCDGFEVLRALDPDELPIVIFTTAYSQYAIRAFEAHAFDYLLKPFDQERLHEAIERAKAEKLRIADGAMAQRLRKLLENMDSKQELADRLIVKFAGRITFIATDEIDWIEAAGNYARIHVNGKFHLLREPVTSLASRLSQRKFARIHRSVIVNVARIRELQRCNSGEFMVVLRDGKELPCSRGYREALEPLLS